MTFKTVQNLALTSRNVNQGSANIRCPLRVLEMEYVVIKYSWPSQQEKILISRNAVQRWEQDLDWPGPLQDGTGACHSSLGHQFCNPGLRHLAS